jgi:hypothetical protein
LQAVGHVEPGGCGHEPVGPQDGQVAAGQPVDCRGDRPNLVVALAVEFQAVGIVFGHFVPDAPPVPVQVPLGPGRRRPELSKRRRPCDRVEATSWGTSESSTTGSHRSRSEGVRVKPRKPNSAAAENDKNRIGTRSTGLACGPGHVSDVAGCCVFWLAPAPIARDDHGHSGRPSKRHPSQGQPLVKVEGTSCTHGCSAVW